MLFTNTCTGKGNEKASTSTESSALCVSVDFLASIQSFVARSRSAFFIFTFFLSIQFLQHSLYRSSGPRISVCITTIRTWISVLKCIESIECSTTATQVMVAAAAAAVNPINRIWITITSETNIIIGMRRIKTKTQLTIVLGSMRKYQTTIVSRWSTKIATAKYSRWIRWIGTVSLELGELRYPMTPGAIFKIRNPSFWVLYVRS